LGVSGFFLVGGGGGGGDVKLRGAIGALMGWKFSLLTALYSALVGGAMVIVFLLYTGKLRDSLKKVILSTIRLLSILMNKLGYNEKIDHLQQRFIKNGQEYNKIYIPYGVAIAGGTVLVLIVSNQGFHIF
jgi:prepilin peptidase CpaA